MNKYQEAYEEIQLTCRCVDDSKDSEEYLKPIRELVDKTTPKKPALDEDLRDEETTDIYDECGRIAEGLCVCPTCKGKSIYDFEYGKRFKHCSNCGQAIDWGDEE